MHACVQVRSRGHVDDAAPSVCLLYVTLERLENQRAYMDMAMPASCVTCIKDPGLVPESPASVCFRASQGDGVITQQLIHAVDKNVHASTAGFGCVWGCPAPQNSLICMIATALSQHGLC
jgi:hypothetical protein